MQTLRDDPADADIVAQIKELIETRVRPAVANDGGDIVYRGFREGVVYLDDAGRLLGLPSPPRRSSTGSRACSSTMSPKSPKSARPDRPSQFRSIPLSQPLSDAALDQLFRTARTYNGYLDKPVSTEQLHAIWDLMKMGPTSANMLPARLVW